MKKRVGLLSVIAVSVVMVGCSRDDNPAAPEPAGSEAVSVVVPGTPDSHLWHAPAMYEVTIENLTSSQPFSPPVVATHSRWVRMFRRGHRASPEIEAIAEDGNEAPMFNALDGKRGVTDVVPVGMPLTRRGTTVGDFKDNVTFQIKGRRHDRLSLATMLICTNDGFAGLNAVRLPAHGTRTYWLEAYDAGTETNTEQGTDIVDACNALGPVDIGGVGNENDAVDSKPHEKIRHHRGISGHGDLSPDLHGWRGAVLKVTVTRLSE